MGFDLWKGRSGKLLRKEEFWASVHKLQSYLLSLLPGHHLPADENVALVMNPSFLAQSLGFGWGWDPLPAGWALVSLCYFDGSLSLWPWRGYGNSLSQEKKSFKAFVSLLGRKAFSNHWLEAEMLEVLICSSSHVVMQWNSVEQSKQSQERIWFQGACWCLVKSHLKLHLSVPQIMESVPSLCFQQFGS